MPSSQKGSASGFAAAAKVLFDSAQRVGAVLPLEQSTKQYAHQLKKIQSQSKKRGGSLGSASHKVAEFLAAQRTPAPFPSPRTTVALERTIAKKKYRLSTSRHYSQEKKPLQGPHFPRWQRRRRRRPAHRLYIHKAVNSAL